MILRVRSTMRSTTLLFALALPTLLSAQEAASPATSASRTAARASALMRASELRTLRADPSVVILQVGTPAQFAEAHVPGARPVALNDVSTPRQNGALILEIPDTPTLEAWARSVGISDASRRIVVVPVNDTLQSSTRVLFTLAFMGFADRVTLLDGGLAAWRAAGEPVATGEAPALAPSSAPLTVRRDSSIVAVLGDVEAATKATGTTIIDARLPQFYNGEGGGYPRPGRIPTAVNVPLSLVSEAGRLRTPDELHALFSAAGVKPGQPVITYCHIGQQASLLWFVARELGYDVRLFDGSFQQWSGTSLPLGSPE
jgi:thiosulfate/3-mercaptopyruvate sulfurtransferase